jgi:hypothetical protein
MAEELSLRRRIILPVPVLTPRLSSLWINFVTPVSYRIARPLAACECSDYVGLDQAFLLRFTQDSFSLTSPIYTAS